MSDMTPHIQARQDQACASVRNHFETLLRTHPELLVTFTEDAFASTVAAWIANVGCDISDEMDRLGVPNEVSDALRLRMMAWTSMFSETVSKVIGQ